MRIRIGRRLPRFAQARDDVEPRQPRQAEIDNSGVVRVFGGEVQRLLALAGGVHRVALRLEASAHLLLQGRLVFDDQDAHGVAMTTDAI